MQLNDMRGWNIESQNVIWTGSNEYTYSFPKMKLYVMKIVIHVMNIQKILMTKNAKNVKTIISLKEEIVLIPQPVLQQTSTILS